MSCYFFVCLFFVFAVEGGVIRPKRSSGRANIPALIKTPSRLRPGETTIPPPGWTHCIRYVNAGSNWRFIDANEFTTLETTQFQCTWIVQTSRYQGVKLQKQIQISVQKLNLGSAKDVRCIRQFVEIIDQGKSQGRFCDRMIPGDYITLGGDVRLDVQGVESLANQVKDKKNPFVIAVRAVSKLEPGFRFHPTKIKGYNPDSTTYNGNSNNNVDEITDDNDETDSGGGLTVGGLVGIIICCVLVACLIVLVLVKKYCFAKGKTDKDKPKSHQEDEIDSSVYPPPYAKAVSLPHHPSTAADQRFHHYPPQIEVVIKNETIQNQTTNQKANRSKAKTIKKSSAPSKTETSSASAKQKNENKKHKQKLLSTKTSRAPKLNKTKNEKKEVKRTSKLPSRRYPSAALQMKSAKAKKSKELNGKRRKRRRRENKDETPANRATKPDVKKQKRPQEADTSKDNEKTTNVRLPNRSRDKNKQINKKKTKSKQNKSQNAAKQSKKESSDLPRSRQKSAKN